MGTLIPRVPGTGSLTWFDGSSFGQKPLWARPARSRCTREAQLPGGPGGHGRPPGSVFRRRARSSTATERSSDVTGAARCGLLSRCPSAASGQKAPVGKPALLTRVNVTLGYSPEGESLHSFLSGSSVRSTELGPSWLPLGFQRVPLLFNVSVCFSQSHPLLLLTLDLPPFARDFWFSPQNGR